MIFTIKNFISGDGERFSQLYKVSEPGFPEYYPTAFIARSIRNKTTHETQKVYLEMLKRLSEWEIKNNLDLATSFNKQCFLSAIQIGSLANYLHARRTGKRGDVIGENKYNTYITYTAKYLHWLAQEVITEANTPDVRSALDVQNSMILRTQQRKSGSNSAKTQRIVFSKLPEDARHQLSKIFEDPQNGNTNKKDQGTRYRNIVMLRILYETGMRSGELLSLKLKSFINAKGGDSAYLNIERNHSDAVDHRTNQPVAKTLGRKVPISESLEEQIQFYIDQWRAGIPRAKSTDDEFIFVVHHHRDSQGLGLPKTTFNTAISHLKKIYPSLNTLHPHLLRHDWNYRFSAIAEAQGMPFEEECTLREYLMGWAPGSESARRYNLRYIIEKAHKIGLQTANLTERPSA